MKTLLSLVCSVSSLMAMVVLSTAQNNRNEGSKCSLAELTKISSEHLKRLQSFQQPYYTSPELKYSDTQVPHFKRRLLLWEFKQIDKNRNDLIEHEEGLRIPVSMVCKASFIKMCDKDQNRGISKQEWLDCFNIPACNKECTSGKLDKIRCKCRCATSVVQGRVTSFLGSPLREARILSSLAPHTQLATTNRNGHFRMTETCSSSQSYTVRKDGYIPVQIEGGSLGATPLVLIQLEDAEPASIIIHPRRRVRLNGQSANFTCEAEGTAPIKIYWYKNGSILQKENVGSVSSLFIADVTGAQGVYTCKAVNEYGSEISNKAVLTVKEPVEDTCTSTPSRHVIELHSGCTVPSNGDDKLKLDIGRCSNEPCAHRDSRSGISVGCTGNEDCCCGPVETSKVEIKCGPLAMNMERVTKCGCTSCVKQETALKGVVLGGPFEEPISNITVVLKKKVVALSDNKGKFYLTVPREYEDRLIVTFQDPNDRYFDTTITLPFQRGQIVFHKVTLQLEDPPVEFDSTQELKVPVGHAEENMAELQIPANTLLQRDGTPYKGKAKLRINVMDPRNATDLLSAPGDFTTVDQFGNVQPLKTYGMLRIKVEDENKQQLSLADNVKLYLDADMIKLPRNSSGEMVPRLWWLDEKTSRWRDMGEMRPTEPNISRGRRASWSGRRFYIGEIQTDRISVVNIDIEWRRCYVRAEVLIESVGGPEPVDGATITLIGKEDEDQQQYYGYTQSVTNQNGVACVPAWCDSNVYLQASRLKFHLAEDKNLGRSISYSIPDNLILESLPPELSVSIVEGNETNSFRFKTKSSSSNGPIFRGDELDKCLDDVNNAKAFRFYAKKMEKAEELNYFGSRPKDHPFSWYTTDPELSEKEVKKCFVKIKTDPDMLDGSVPLISVESYTPDRKERYGFSVKRPFKTVTFWGEFEERVEEFTTCVEYRCSEPSKETFIKVMTLSDACFSSEPIPALIDEQATKWNTTSYSLYGTSFYAPVEVADGKLGLYSGLENAAEENCLHGSGNRDGDAKLTSHGYAVSFVYPWECPGEWFEGFDNENGDFP